MKKLLFSFCLILLSFCGYAQCLECVEVEVYYVSDANDSVGNDAISVAPGTLPVGSVTYRLYANLLQGCNFQAVYGVPGHELRIETDSTTFFFNNEDRGATSPTYTKNNARLNTVMLDSWFSVGAGCSGNFGIMKSQDDGVATVVNSNVPPLLQNNDPWAGIPLTTEDGLILPINNPLPPVSVTFVGFTTQELNMFDNTTNGYLLSTTNASWAALGGATGPDTVDNRVLIGQFTTDGVFSYKLNIQVGTPSGGVENYVAENPVGNEVMLPCLSGFIALGTPDNDDPASSSEPHFSVYPNPAENFVMLSMNNTTMKFLNGTLRIYDLTGKMILNEEVASWERKRREQIDISSLKSGIYFIEATIDGVTSHQKLVKN